MIRALAWLGPAEVEDGLEAILPELHLNEFSELAAARASCPTGWRNRSARDCHMNEVRYQDLSAADRRDALEVADRCGSQKAHLLEKDIWVVAVLSVLFNAPFAGHLTFKGGTSLSKVWRAIRRFSEDVDVTYDIRAFAPDLVAGAGDEALPPTRSQEKRWTRAMIVAVHLSAASLG